MEDPEVDHEAAAALVIDGGDGNPKKKRKIIPRGSCTNPACPRALTKQLTFFPFLLPCCFPVPIFSTCPVKVSKFYHSHFLHPSFLPPLLPSFLPSGSQCRSQWALLDPKGECQTSVGTAGPQLQAPDPSGHCRTPTATARKQRSQRQCKISVCMYACMHVCMVSM